MNRRKFIAISSVAIVSSCARMEKRTPRYDEKQCPFCTTKPGSCNYCNGTGKCTFCKGTGKRKTVTPYIADENIKPASYEEECPFCKGTGKCRYCQGSGKCHVCKGTGKIDNWDFYNQLKKDKSNE